eukprot:11929457-Alexandrium_andersonii.AAC.1
MSIIASCNRFWTSTMLPKEWCETRGERERSRPRPPRPPGRLALRATSCLRRPGAARAAAG